MKHLKEFEDLTDWTRDLFSIESGITFRASFDASQTDYVAPLFEWAERVLEDSFPGVSFSKPSSGFKLVVRTGGKELYKIKFKSDCRIETADVVAIMGPKLDEVKVTSKWIHVNIFVANEDEDPDELIQAIEATWEVGTPNFHLR